MTSHGGPMEAPCRPHAGPMTSHGSPMEASCRPHEVPWRPHADTMQAPCRPQDQLTHEQAAEKGPRSTVIKDYLVLFM